MAAASAEVILQWVHLTVAPPWKNRGRRRSNHRWVAGRSPAQQTLPSGGCVPNLVYPFYTSITLMGGYVGRRGQGSDRSATPPRKLPEYPYPDLLSLARAGFGAQTPSVNASELTIQRVLPMPPAQILDSRTVCMCVLQMWQMQVSP